MRQQQIEYKIQTKPFQRSLQLPQFIFSHFKTHSNHKPLFAKPKIALKMKQTFINNIQQLMLANQNQRIKISYLESQKQKRQEYLSGLKQSILLNKQTLIVLNEEGPNNAAIDQTSKQNLLLIKLNQTMYNQNRQLNALLLMQQQLRAEDKAFYVERINEFQNRITDLRKYLHDKEESFSSVVVRLKKYEDWNEKPLNQKIQDPEGLKKLQSQIISQLMSEKNMYKAKYEQVYHDAHRYQVMERALGNKKNLERFIEHGYNSKVIQTDRKAYSQKDLNLSQLKPLPQTQQKKSPLGGSSLSIKSQTNGKPNTIPFKQTQMTRELMRLLKKQKINNQILQTALHTAIEKNEELIKINQNLESVLIQTQKKLEKVIAQNYFYRLKNKQFSGSYGRKYDIKKVKEDDEKAILSGNGLGDVWEIKDDHNETIPHKIYKNILTESLKQDIDRLMKLPIRTIGNCSLKSKSIVNRQSLQASSECQQKQMTTNQQTKLHQQLPKKQQSLQKPSSNQYQKAMIKSASQPRIVFQWEEVNHEDQEEEIVVEEF